MNILAIFGIAVALAMDAFAASIASGITIRHLKIRHALTIAACFGFFQAVMPLIGWLGGARLQRYVAPADHWIAFGLLGFIGIKMVYEALKLQSIEEKRDPLDIYVLFVLSVATSVDALVAGFTFALLATGILTPVIVIGAITFCMSFAGVLIGDRIGHFFEKRIEIAAGLLLIGIGAGILISHLM
jgi:putative Mn2+ efflux pump MntP